MLAMGIAPNLWLSAIESGVKPAAAIQSGQQDAGVKFDPKRMVTLNIKADPANAGGQK